MITLELNEHTLEDWKCVEELRKMGFTDETIQALYYAAKERREKGNDLPKMPKHQGGHN